MCEEKVEGNSGCFFLFWLWFSLHQCDWGIKKDEKQCGCFSTFAFKREVSTNLVLKREEKMGKMLLALIEDSGYLKGKMSLFLINPNVPTAKFSLHYAWGDWECEDGYKISITCFKNTFYLVYMFIYRETIYYWLPRDLFRLKPLSTFHFAHLHMNWI